MNKTWFFFGFYMLWRWLTARNIRPEDICITITLKEPRAMAGIERGVLEEAHPISEYPIPHDQVAKAMQNGLVPSQHTFMGMELKFEKGWNEAHRALRPGYAFNPFDVYDSKAERPDPRRYPTMMAAKLKADERS